MPANHCIPHTEATKNKIRIAKIGKPALWRHRPSKIIDGVIHYRCGRCGEFFVKEGFYKSNTTLLGIKSTCKKCHSVVSVSSRNRENNRLICQRGEAARRARKAGTINGVKASDWGYIIGILGSACLKCYSVVNPTQDHIIPLSKGGIHHPTNLQPLCRSCNEIKHTNIVDYRTDEQREKIAAMWPITFRRI